ARADAAPPALQCLGLLLELLCPLPELLFNLWSDSDPQQVPAALGFRPHIVSVKHGGSRLSPPMREQSSGDFTPRHIEGVPPAARSRADRLESRRRRRRPISRLQIYTQATMTKMIAHCTQGGESIDQAIAWAADELEGFMRG